MEFVHKKKIQVYPRLSTTVSGHELGRLLGIINFHRRCFPDTARKQHFIFALIPDRKKKSHRAVQWTEKALENFQRLKQDLKEATPLSHPDPASPFCLTVDASLTAIGAALQQKRGSKIVLPAFFS